MKPDEFVEQILAPVQERRNVARLLHCRARYLASTGKPDEAAMTCVQLLRLARLQQNEPLVISFLVDIAIRGITFDGLNGILQTSELRPETHHAIDEQLTLHDSLDGFVHVLKGERAYGIETFQNRPDRFGLFKTDFRNYLTYMEQQIATGAKSPFEMVDEPDAPREGLAGGIVPGIQASREALNRARATARCLRIVNAIYWRTMQTDDIEFDDLRLPENAGVDPYNGEPLNIRKTDDGWLVYAVGMDGMDDGGLIADSIRDIGVGPPEPSE